MKTMSRCPEELHRQLPFDLKTETSPQDKSAFLLDQLQLIVDEVIHRVLIDPPDGLALQIVQTLADRLGGQEIYLPKGDRLRLTQRDQAILGAIQSGRPYWRIALQYSMSVERVRQIARKSRL